MSNAHKTCIQKMISKKKRKEIKIREEKVEKNLEERNEKNIIEKRFKIKKKKTEKCS